MQLVTDPTRADNILDIILTNEPTIISKVSICKPFTKSQVQFCVNVISEDSVADNSYSIEKRFLWHEAGYGGMNSYSVWSWLVWHAVC